MYSLASALYAISLALSILQQNQHKMFASALVSWSLECASNAWFDGAPKTLHTISADRINDGYCDCPLDGLDEPETGACSGSMDGMWAGVPAIVKNAAVANSFVCPQQPSLRLPLSRVNDGICDCCDGADEHLSPLAPSASSSEPSTSACPDICDAVLAAERAAKAKAEEDYKVGSQKRLESIAQYQKWNESTRRNLQQLKDVELAKVNNDVSEVEQELMLSKIALAKEWLRVVKEDVLNSVSLMGIVGKTSQSSSNNHMSLDDLASFIISLCWVSGEASSANVASGRCLPLDRASIDVGILWDHTTEESLPTFHYLDSDNEASLLDFGEKILLRLEGNDSTTEKPLKKNNKQYEKDESEPDYGDDDYFGDDYEDYRDEGDVESSDSTEVASSETDEIQQKEPNPDDSMVGSRLKRLHLASTRQLFKEQAKLLLEYASSIHNESEEEENGHEESSSLDERETLEGGEETKSPHSSGIDPMAVKMVTSTIGKRLSNISRGEASAKSAAPYIVSLMKNRSGGGSVLDDLQSLAIMAMYHSNVRTKDLAEIVYTTSSEFHSATKTQDETSCSAVSPWSNMCPPRVVSLQGDAKHTFPPPFVFEAARQRCEKREDALVGVCTAGVIADEKEFPTSMPEGYYNYYTPQPRGSADELSSLFSNVDTLHKMPTDIVELKERKGKLDNSKKSLLSTISKLESETGSGGNSPKFGVDGELYIIRDTCHTVESGKYEYEVCIFGKATQRDAGQKSGGTNLGSWDKVERYDGGRRLKWSGGTKCWNGPARSAEVVVTCGSETKLLAADEPETCRYVFQMESPIGCDEAYPRYY